MKLGIFSDVHSNLTALDAVLALLKEQGADEYLCCGDLVGYGPDPGPCVKRLRQLKMTVVAGNHDYGVLGQTPVSSFNRAAQAAIVWTRKQLKEDDFAFLDSLPLVERVGNFTLVHGSPSAPENWEYIFSVREAAEEMGYFAESCCIVGHSHYPFAVERRNGDTVHLLPHASFDLKPDQKYLVNAGSVGQPRDGDPRACCLLFDTRGRKMTFFRVEYDIPAVQTRIRAAGLPEFLATRLAAGR